MDNQYTRNHHPKLVSSAVKKVTGSSIRSSDMFLQLLATGNHLLTSVCPSVADLCEAPRPHIHATGLRLDLLSHDVILVRPIISTEANRWRHWINMMRTALPISSGQKN
jgi:hypothetical protein